MSDAIIIDKAHARRFLLTHLHLLPPRKLRDKPGIVEFVRQVHCIQYDPIDSVGQNSHLVLQSRVRGYRPAMLHELLYHDRALVDGFDKQMSIYPREDWSQFTYHRQRMAGRYLQAKETAAAAKLVHRVRKEIESRGPLSSLDLEDETRMEWWLTDTVRAVRVAMDILFYSGETVVHHRTGTRRYFDLSTRVLPAKLLRAAKKIHRSHEEYLDWHVLRRAGGLGLVDRKITAEFGGMVGWQGGKIRAAIVRLAKSGKLLPVTIKGFEKQTFYIRATDEEALDTAAKVHTRKEHAAFIAPLDNLMWDRNLVELLFNFSYTWEVYVPETKRAYGYYVLPVLYGDRLVARINPVLDRSTRVLTIKNWWWEAGVDIRDAPMLSAIGGCLKEFARYLRASGIQVGKEVRDQNGLKRAVREAE